MGNINGKNKSTPLKLTGKQILMAIDGELFATFSDVWCDSGEMKDYTGAYERLAKLRRGFDEAGRAKAPKHLRDLAEVCCEVWDRDKDYAASKASETGSFRWLGDLVELFTNWTSTTSNSGTNNKPLQVQNSEGLKQVDRDGARKNLTMFGPQPRHSLTRAHILPNNPSCKVFWGKVCEVLSGIDLDEASKGLTEEDAKKKKTFVRNEMAKSISRMKMNRFGFPSSHNSYFDLLENGECLMLIPLLSLKGIAEWKQGVGYEVLVCCSNENSHVNVGKGGWTGTSDFPHLKWEDDEDVELATEVLTAHVKALADSLNQHWDDYYNKVSAEDSGYHKDFTKKQQHMQNAKAHLSANFGKVEVPQLKSLRFRKKFYKIDLGELYKDDDLKRLIPDPALFAFKAAVNWSGRTPQSRFRKLLPCWSPEEDSHDESYYSGLPSDFSFTSGLIAAIGEDAILKAAEDYAKQREADILQREVTYMSANEDDDDISEISNVESSKDHDLIGFEGGLVSGDFLR